MTQIVSDIQRFSVHDGPGIRTTVFLKGCQMRCRWCHNPESFSAEPQLQLFPDKCIGCEACINACPNHAHARQDDGRIFKRALCAACGNCSRCCYAEALVLVGREMTADDVLADVMHDKAYYLDSHGGVTLSGGEPLCQVDFARDILRLCQSEGIHTAIETNLAWPWQHVASVLDVTDLVIADIKVMDPEEHVKWTEVSNEQVLDNVLRLERSEKPLIVRTPVVPGVNDTPEQIGAIADFIAPLSCLVCYDLLPLHPLGAGKYESLGMDCRAADLPMPSAAAMRKLAEEARERGITVRVAGQKND